jgi:hypothetical protein
VERRGRGGGQTRSSRRVLKNRTHIFDKSYASVIEQRSFVGRDESADLTDAMCRYVEIEKAGAGIKICSPIGKQLLAGNERGERKRGSRFRLAALSPGLAPTNPLTLLSSPLSLRSSGFYPPESPFAPAVWRPSL